jgi:hypothetical protein
MWGCLKFAYEPPNQITLNWTMRRQTKAPNTKSSREICPLPGYQTAQSGKFLQTFQDKLSAPSSKVKKSKRENRNNWSSQTLVFFWHSVQCLTVSESLHLRNRLCSRFQAEKRQVQPLGSDFLNHAHHRKSNLLGCALENRSSPKGSNWKMAIEKLRINYNMQK